MMNSANYYHKKYIGEMPLMQEVFPIDDSSNIQSPSKAACLPPLPSPCLPLPGTPACFKAISLLPPASPLLSCLFLPPCPCPYNLLYGPLNIYMFLTLLYSIYERILRA